MNADMRSAPNCSGAPPMTASSSWVGRKTSIGLQSKYHERCSFNLHGVNFRQGRQREH